MKLWRTRDGYLAEHGRDFVLVSSDGLVVRWFGSRDYSDEDDLWHWQPGVVGNALYERTTVERGPIVTEREAELLLDDLVEIDDHDLTTLIERAIATDRDTRAEESLRAARAGDARVAAIVGDLRDDGLRPELVRAKAALAVRVRAYDDSIAARLLSTMVLVARARPGSAVEVAYARGCLAACFEHAPSEGKDEPARPLVQEARAALAAELEMRAAELEQKAEWNEYIDASRTADAYFRAAVAIRAAARVAAGIT